MFFFFFLYKTFFTCYFSDYSTKALQRARQVRRSADAKSHADLSVFAPHLHQHQCDKGLLPRGAREAGSIRLENGFYLSVFGKHTRSCHALTMGQLESQAASQTLRVCGACVKVPVMANQT